MARFAALLLLLFCLPAEAWAQKATAVAKTVVDLNADGKNDEIRLDEMGNITVHIAGSERDGAWTTLQTMGKVVGGSVEVAPKPDDKGRHILVIKAVLRAANAKRRDEAVVLAYQPGALQSVWRGRIGLAGRDGATTISLEVGRYGLIKYSNRHGVVRCDGETAHLDAQRFDPGSGRFRPVRQSVRVSQKSRRLQSSEATPVGIDASAEAFLFRAQGASSSTRARSVAELVAPTALTDGDPKTAWVENKGGFGRGEFVTLKAGVGAVSVRALRLQLGHGGAYRDYDRPKRLALLLGPHERYWIDVPKDPKAVQWVVLPTPVQSDCVSLVIDEVYPGRKSKGKTAISEIGVLSDEELDPAGSAALLAQRVAAGEATADLRRLLGRLGPQAAPAFEAAIASAKSPRAIVRLRLALAQMPAGPEQLVLGLMTEGLQSRQQQSLAKGIIALEGAGLKALAAALKDAMTTDAGYERVVKLLAQVPGAGAATILIDNLGEGSARRRRALERAIGPRADLVSHILQALAAESPKPTRLASLYRALGLTGQSSPPEERGALVEALRKALEEAPSEQAYQVEHRLVQAAAQIGGPALLAALLDRSESMMSAPGAEGIALARLLASVLSPGPMEAEGPLLERLQQFSRNALSHSDPGVRMAAIGSLEPSAWAISEIVARLQADRWPEVRRSAAAALSRIVQSRPVTQH